MIRTVKAEDVNEITEIYNYYILNSIITFEESLISMEEMGDRIENVTSEFPWIVYEKDQQILGYAYAAKWRTRSAYDRSVESTVYLKHGASKKGIGTLLYLELIKQLKNTDLHVVIGGISLPNDASIALHEKLGFVKVAHFKEVGFKFNQWIDVGYWELIMNEES